MKAAIFEEYWEPEVLKIKDIEKPIPKENEILVKVYAVPVNSGDCRMRRPDPFVARFITGFIHPIKKILGVNLAWKVESIWKNVTKFKVWDDIYGSTWMSFWAYAEYKCLSENAVIFHMPKNMDFKEASSVIFWGWTALHFLEKANIKKWQNVLIYGASWSVWTAAIQLAKYYWANVTWVCSWVNADMVKSLWADNIIDYKKEDYTKSDKKYDVIYDTVGKTSYLQAKDSLDDNGLFVSNNAGLSDYSQLIKTSIFWWKKIITGVVDEKIEHLEILNKLIESWDFISQIDKEYHFDDIVEAHKYVEWGHKKGNVILNIT